jgi:hypothetical protein
VECVARAILVVGLRCRYVDAAAESRVQFLHSTRSYQCNHAAIGEQLRAATRHDHTPTASNGDDDAILGRRDFPKTDGAFSLVEFDSSRLAIW